MEVGDRLRSIQQHRVKRADPQRVKEKSRPAGRPIKRDGKEKSQLQADRSKESERAEPNCKPKDRSKERKEHSPNCKAQVRYKTEVLTTAIDLEESSNYDHRGEPAKRGQ